jgi:hypothetical protein
MRGKAILPLYLKFRLKYTNKQCTLKLALSGTLISAILDK